MRYYLLKFKTLDDILYFDKVSMRDAIFIIKEQMLKHYNLTEQQYVIHRDVLNCIIKGKSVNRLLTSIITMIPYPNVRDINAVLSIKS